MNDSTLRLAAEIYAPFGERETRRLRGYVEDVEALVSMRFFQGGEQAVTVSFSKGGPLQTTLRYPGEEAVRAVVGLFRQVYKPHEPTSYNQILKLLERHVHERDSSHRGAAEAELKRLREWEKDVLRPTSPTMQLIHDGEELTPELLIDLFLHGRYLHKGNPKSDKLDAWPLAQVAQQSFFQAMMGLSEVYWVGANVVREVLKVPALLDAPSTTP